jgi:uncharacterized protein (TIGR02996 family)
MDQTKQALLMTIRAKPEDNAPRLIFADWLEENGEEERAKLVREHLLHPRRDPHFGTLIWRLLGDELGELCTFRRGEKRHFGHQGTATVLVGNQFSLVRVILERGFVSEIRTNLSTFFAICRGIVQNHPVYKWSISGPSPLNTSRDSRWFCVSEGQVDSPHGLPLELYCLLDGYKETENTSEYAIYDSQKDANSALERACLRYSLLEQAG